MIGTPLSSFSALLNDYMGFQIAQLQAMQRMMALPYRLSVEAASYAFDQVCGIELETMTAEQEPHIPSLMVDFDEHAMMVAESEGMNTVAPPSVSVRQEASENARDLGTWTFKRPYANQDDELMERRMGTRLVYTPQGSAPDTPSAKRVLERHRARKLRQVG